MPDLLFELGVEEFPATFVKKAYQDLEAAIISRLDEAGIGHGESQSLGTPRRLIIHVAEVQDRQPDVTKEMRGPGVNAAYDAEGKPTKALEGFCRGQGVEVSAVRKDGDYVWVSKTIPGRPTGEVLAELLPAAVKSLSFDKSMRWGAARMRFARPIRWMLASFGGNLVPFEIENVKSGLLSRGHRFNFPDPFEAKTYDELLNGLLARQVEADPAEREKRIREGAYVIASGKPQMTDTLVEENTFLTEWPTPLEGEFKAEYLELPDPVLVTAMAKHEKMFPVRDGAGKLTNKFIFIRNGGVDEVVREGNAWVLSARFNDAKFFFDEDKKHDLAWFLERSTGMLFQEKLGTVRQRADRLAALAAAVAQATGADEAEVEMARKAGLYAKADLSTGLVSELPALQGVIGGEYAKREGWDEAVCWAIATHYDLAKNPAINGAGPRTAVRVLIADQLDKLAGYLGLGLLPSGSSDPFGLRRAATLLIDAALRWPGTFPGYARLLAQAVKQYQGHEFSLGDVAAALSDIVRSRYPLFFEEARYDVVEAALGIEDLDPQSVRFRIQALTSLCDDTAFVQTATRPLNIVAAAQKKNEPMGSSLDDLDLAKLDSATGTALAGAVRAAAPKVAIADVAGLRAELKALQAPINAFFDDTMVMAEDAAVRQARLTLLNVVSGLLRRAGDFSKLVQA